MAANDYLPRSSSAGLLGSSFMPPGVVLSDSPLGVHSEADVNSPLKLGVGAVQHVHPIKALHLHHHGALQTSPATKSSKLRDLTGFHGNTLSP